MNRKTREVILGCDELLIASQLTETQAIMFLDAAASPSGKLRSVESFKRAYGLRNGAASRAREALERSPLVRDGHISVRAVREEAGRLRSNRER